jgi:hypothetical protein
MKTVSARQANHDFSKLIFARGTRGGNPDHEMEQTRGVIVPLSAAAADSGTASRYQSCNRGDGTRATLGRDPGNFYAR